MLFSFHSFAFHNAKLINNSVREVWMWSKIDLQRFAADNTANQCGLATHIRAIFSIADVRALPKYSPAELLKFSYVLHYKLSNFPRYTLMKKYGFYDEKNFYIYTSNANVIFVHNLFTLKKIISSSNEIFTKKRTNIRINFATLSLHHHRWSTYKKMS